jgi:hypothetical protein
MWLCARCGLAQLAEDPTVPDEPRGQEPAALVEQAADAVSRAAAAGLLPAGGTVAEYGSPHGGSWLGLLTERGLRVAEPSESADVVVDCFGLIHEADQAAALARRVARLRPRGLLLVQFHSLATIVRGGQWNALRHAHYAYYSAPTLIAMLARVGLTARTAFTFPLYGGTVALALTRGEASDETVAAFAAEELTAGVLRPEVVGELQQTALDAATRLASWVAQERAAGRRVLGYSAGCSGTAPRRGRSPCCAAPGSPPGCCRGSPMPHPPSKGAACPEAVSW